MTDTEGMGTAVDKLVKLSGEDAAEKAVEKVVRLSGVSDRIWVSAHSKVSPSGEHYFVEGYYRDPRGEVVFAHPEGVTPQKVSKVLKDLGLPRGGWSASGKVKGWGNHMEGFETEQERSGPTRVYGGNMVPKTGGGQFRTRTTRQTPRPTGRVFVTWQKGEKHQNRTEAEAFDFMEDALAIAGLVTYRETIKGNMGFPKQRLVVEPKLPDNVVNDAHLQRGAARFEKRLVHAIEQLRATQGPYWEKAIAQYSKLLYKARGFKTAKAYLEALQAKVS